MGYIEQPMKMELYGNFDSYYSFLIDLEQLPRITRIRELELKKDPNVDNPWAVAWSIYNKQKKSSLRTAKEKCPECGGRIVLDGTEHVCIACGKVSGREYFDDSLSYLSEREEDKGIDMTELVLGHGDLARRGGKSDLAGKPGTPDFDNSKYKAIPRLQLVRLSER
jgi:ribosomal protein S27AE